MNLQIYLEILWHKNVVYSSNNITGFIQSTPEQYGIEGIGHREDGLLVIEDCDSLECYSISDKSSPEYSNNFSVYYKDNKPYVVYYNYHNYSYIRMLDNGKFVITHAVKRKRKVINPLSVKRYLNGDLEFKYFVDYITVNYIFHVDTVIICDIILDDDPIKIALGMVPIRIIAPGFKERLKDIPARFMSFKEICGAKKEWYYPITEWIIKKKNKLIQ